MTTTTISANNPKKNITKETVAQVLGVQVAQIHSIRIWWRVVLVHGKNFCKFVSKKLFQPEQPEVKGMDTAAKEKIRITLPKRRRTWYKKVSSIDRSKKFGYALEGEFVSPGVQEEYEPGDVLVKMEPRGAKPEYHVTYAANLQHDEDNWSRAYDRGDFLDFLDLVDSYLSEESSEEDTEEGKSIQECWENAQCSVLDANALATEIRAQGGEVSNEQVLEALHSLGIG